MTITDEQIEKAAKAAYESQMQNLHMPSNWDRQHEWDRIVERRAARAALEAVMPEGDKRLWPNLDVANAIRDTVNEALARYDVPSDVYEQDILIDAACVQVADNLAHPAPEPGELEPDYCFDPAEWDSTYNWDTRDQVHCWGDAIPAVGDMMEVHTLIEGPTYWVARVPVSYTEDGDVDETTYEWFRSEAEARAALGAGGRDE